MPLLRRLLPLLPFALLGGCRDDSGQDEAGVGTPPPPATTAAPGTTTEIATSEATSSTGAAPTGCDCASDEFCAAPHQGGVIDPADERLVYACQAECVAADAPDFWCREDQPSCCAGLDCDAHGFCVDPSAAGSESTAGATGTGTSTGTGSDTATESSSGATGSGTTAGTSGTTSAG